MKVSPVTAKRRWNNFKNNDLCHLNIVAEYAISQYQHVFVAYSEVTSLYMLAVFDSIEQSLIACQEFKSRKDADLDFAQKIISKWDSPESLSIAGSNVIEMVK